MIEIKQDKEANAKRKYMLADFSRDTENSVVIKNVRMDKDKRWNRMDKNRQKAVAAYLRQEAGKSFEVKHNSKIVLVFKDDGSEVEITFKQAQERS